MPSNIIERDTLIFEAIGLVSDGSNKEYDRALIELITFASGGTADDFIDTTVEIFGRERPDLWA